MANKCQAIVKISSLFRTRFHTFHCLRCTQGGLVKQMERKFLDTEVSKSSNEAGSTELVQSLSNAVKLLDKE